MTAAPSSLAIVGGRRSAWAACAALGVMAVATWASGAAPAMAKTGVGTWRAAARPGTPRVSDQTATLLPDGRVLVVGGIPAGDYSKDAATAAELFSPATGRWTPAGALASGRQYHTATALADGRVLVAGGILESTLVADAEIYDPASGRWAAAGTMVQGRIGHTATLLPDGRVLVAGGLAKGAETPLEFTDSAEVFDPARRTWTAVAPMGQPRSEHTATLLADGTALVAGGRGLPYGAGSTLRDSLLFNPATGAWSTVPHLLNAARAGHTATLLPDGKVLLAGGAGDVDHGGGGQPTASVEIYDPGTKNWVPAPPLRHARIAHTATLLPGGAVLAIGGLGKEDETRHAHGVTPAEVFDPATRQWTDIAAPPMPATSEANRDMRVWMLGGHHSATLLDRQPCGAHCGAVLVLGGDSAGAQLYSAAGGSGAGAAGGTHRSPLVLVASVALAAAVGLGAVLARTRRRTHKDPGERAGTAPPKRPGTAAVAVVVGVAGALTAGAAAASAHETSTIAASAQIAAPGARVSVVGEAAGVAPGTTVEIRWGDAAGPILATPSLDGHSFAADVLVPDAPPGASYLVLAAGGRRLAGLPFEVDAIGLSAAPVLAPGRSSSTDRRPLALFAALAAVAIGLSAAAGRSRARG